MRFVAYYRVSKVSKKLVSLGIEAQRDAVAHHASAEGLVAEFVEMESGKRADNRPQLQAALAECRKSRCVLLIARLDRLSRNVAFIAALMESGVEFVACDMPTASRLTIHILAAVAEHEREMISARTKAALAAAKAQGTVLGNPQLAAAREKARASHIASRPSPEVSGLIADWHSEGKSYREIARRLNGLNIRPARGKAWYGTSVASILTRVA